MQSLNNDYIPKKILWQVYCLALSVDVGCLKDLFVGMCNDWLVVNAFMTFLFSLNSETNEWGE
jgi:hypothetical protein